MAVAWSVEIESAMDKSRPLVCLIRSVRIERIIGRRLSPGESGDSPRPWLKVTYGTLSAPARRRGYVVQDIGNRRS
jgi:hypothetical protein